MGVIKKGILGGFQNKVGPVVGSTWKGIDVIKAKPTSVANPNTLAQQEQRNAMKAINVFLRSFGLDNVKKLNNAMSVRMSGYNRCVKKVHNFKPGNELSGHVKCVASGPYPVPAFDHGVAFERDAIAKTVTVGFGHAFSGDPQPDGTELMVTVMDSSGTICTPAVYGTADSDEATIDTSKFASQAGVLIGYCFVSADGMSTSDVVTCTA